MIWQVVKAALEHAVPPQQSLTLPHLRRQEELLRKNYLAIVKVVVFFLVAGVFLSVVNLWGVDQTFLVWLSQGLSWGTRLGPLHLTLLNLMLAALALYLGRWFSRFLQVFLEVRFSQRGDWDDSLRYTIANSLHYAILAVALVMALGFLGISFGDLAIVAGGLGVGIGFGLQNIVNNFISGLIILFERPIKVGDTLVIDGKWGRVREIRVRSTIFENSDHSVLIIPNSDLISNKILNWTHYGPGINRLTLKVGVSYDSDVHQVTRVLDRVCRANLQGGGRAAAPDLFRGLRRQLAELHHLGPPEEPHGPHPRHPRAEHRHFRGLSGAGHPDSLPPAGAARQVAGTCRAAVTAAVRG